VSRVSLTKSQKDTLKGEFYGQDFSFRFVV
jgi:hypothetical protein